MRKILFISLIVFSWLVAKQNQVYDVEIHGGIAPEPRTLRGSPEQMRQFCSNKGVQCWIIDATNKGKLTRATPQQIQQRCGRKGVMCFYDGTINAKLANSQPIKMTSEQMEEICSRPNVKCTQLKSKKKSGLTIKSYKK